MATFYVCPKCGAKYGGYRDSAFHCSICYFYSGIYGMRNWVKVIVNDA